jgi:putative molybdopterin biosynthesis protein
MEPSPHYLATWPQPPAMPERESYRPREIARRHGLSYSTVYQAIREGRLPSYRIGRAVVVDRADAERWIRAQKGGPLGATTRT